MSKQKIVIKVFMNSADKRSKVMKIAAGFNGVSSTSLEKDKDLLTVVGEDVDPVLLVQKLRKDLSKLDFCGCFSLRLPSYFGRKGETVEMINVGPADDKKKEEEKKEEEKIIWPYTQPYVFCEVPADQGSWWRW